MRLPHCLVARLHDDFWTPGIEAPGGGKAEIAETLRAWRLTHGRLIHCARQ
jgi:hypothetical protein